MYKSVPANLQPTKTIIPIITIALMIEVNNIDPRKRTIVNDEKENVTEIETERETEKEIEEIDQIGIKKEIEIGIEKETERKTGIGKEIEKEIEIERKTGRGIRNETEKGNEIEKEIVTEIKIVIVKAVDGAENEIVIVNVAEKDFGVSVKKEKKGKQEGLDVQEGEVEALVQDVVVTARRDIVRVLDR